MIRLVLLSGGTLCAGVVAAYITYALLFTTPYAGLLPDILLPVILLAGMGALAGYLAATPVQARGIALLAALPLVVIALLLFCTGVVDGHQGEVLDAVRKYLPFLLIALIAPLLSLFSAHVARSLKA